MENNIIYCSSKNHNGIIGISFCQECRIYMCDKCNKIHEELYNHHQLNLNEDFRDIFTGFCKEKNHPIQLEYFCKTHNLLCCAACIAKIQKKGNGQHIDWDICIIEEIKEINKNKLNNEIELLENLSKNVETSINELKKIYIDMNENKEKMKNKYSTNIYKNKKWN